ncbi:hypothetical protein [Streptomyces sp. LBL]|uniref:hypothetical protein n=1 Tax=Streptomyces sp. LBL TaxID=2940562 RepID=UPI0024732C0E|nr:hypothetical protein [Streptomyces sp. LBL]
MLQTFVPDPHGPYPKQPHSAWGSVEEDGSICFRMRCWQRAFAPQWEQVVLAAHVRQLVREFVDKALNTDADGPGPDSA